jgi:DNA-directed RNA polymerase subunit alpha
MPMTLDEVATLIETGELDKAERQLSAAPPSTDDAVRRCLLKGQLHERRGEIELALAAYEEGLRLDPDHAECAFHAAFLHDLRGNDAEAIQLYELCTSAPPISVNALLNLALLYEESEHFEEARSCLESILDQYPTHPRAMLFLKDLKATMTMVVDDEAVRQSGERGGILDMALADFELSVRSRNCLRQMNIHTVGDILRVTEAELMAFKNFGETSLNEVKALLSSKGLVIGQLAAATTASTPAEPEGSVAAAPTETGDPALPQQSVAALNLSVRARRCLQRLGITTIGELTSRTEAELLATKNFGQTSLDEIRSELSQRGLRLRATR